MPITQSSNVASHPQYTEFQPLWQQCLDCYVGEARIKEQSTTYLPKTSQQSSTGAIGAEFYEAYKCRSIFYDFFKKTTQDALGLLHREPTVFDIPSYLQNYLIKTSTDNDNINSFMRRIHEQQLLTGRVGLLLDIDEITKDFISVLYCAERIINWDSTNSPPRWIILDESDNVVDTSTMSYSWKNKYVLLALDERDQYFISRFENWNSALLLGGEDFEYPEYKGKRMNKLPFTFCNASSIISDVELPPLLSLSNISLSLYRGSADYRQALFMQGQATLTFIGLSSKEIDEILSSGMGANNFLATSVDSAKIEYVEVAGNGISEMRESQENLKDTARNLGVELINSGGTESGTALNTRLTIRTANLRTMAETSALAVRNQLQYAIDWAGKTDEIKVTPNIDFVDEKLSAEDLVKMHAVYVEGGITSQDYYKYISENDFTELPYEEWMKELEISSGIQGLI